MKKNDWILCLSVIAYCFLFYNQTAGINFLLFNGLLIGLLGYRNPQVIKNKVWKFVATGALISACAVSIYGNTLAVVVNIISLALLSGFSVHKKTSVIATLLFYLYSCVFSLYFMFADLRLRRNTSSGTGRVLNKIIPVFLAIAVTFIFFIMYRISNPIFNDFVNRFHIEWAILPFAFGGLLLMYGFFYYRRIHAIAELDENGGNNLIQTPHKSIVLFDKNITMEEENASGKILLIMLNALLLIVNILDMDFLFFSRQLPEGLTYSDYVHQGTGMLIFSILSAIAIILFYFRSALNFYEKNNALKALAYAWIIQNAFMLVSTLCRNNMYIYEYGLTYKRIGVYVYLTLTLIGLITTFVKIMKLKSNHYLFRVNSWVFYVTMLLLCLNNWDTTITHYNIHSAKNKGKAYLLDLGYSNLPQLISLQQALGSTTLNSFFPSEISRNEETPDGYNRSLSLNLYYFLLHHQSLGWRSWYLDDTRVYNELVSLNKSGQVNVLDLSGFNLHELENVSELNDVSILYLRSNSLSNLETLKEFSSLQKLDLAYNHLSNIRHIETFSHLKYLSLTGNMIYDYSPVYALKNGLKELHVDEHINANQYRLLVTNMPGTRIIKD